MVLVLEPVIDADVPNDFELVAVSVLDGVSDPLHDGDEGASVTDDIGVCDSEFPLGSDLVGVADSVGGTVPEGVFEGVLDGVPSGELDTEAPVESDAVDDSD